MNSYHEDVVDQPKWLVSFDDKPTPIDDEVIAFLQARVDTDGFLRVGERLLIVDCGEPGPTRFSSYRC